MDNDFVNHETLPSNSACDNGHLWKCDLSYNMHIYSNAQSSDKRFYLSRNVQGSGCPLDLINSMNPLFSKKYSPKKFRIWFFHLIVLCIRYFVLTMHILYTNFLGVNFVFQFFILLKQNMIIYPHILIMERERRKQLAHEC